MSGPAGIHAELFDDVERDSLLKRTVYPTVPAKVEYTATPIAEELHAHLLGLTS